MYGTAGHGKGFINAMSSFGTRNVLRRDTVTQDVFFNQSESIVDYLTVKIQIITIKTYLLKPLHMEGSYGIRYFDGNTWMHETTFDAPHPYYSVTC